MAKAQAGTPGPDEAALLQRFGVPDPDAALLGAGGESRVFALDEQRVLRICHALDDSHGAALAMLIDCWQGHDLGFALPTVLERGATTQQAWTVERRIPGVDLQHFLATAAPERRREALLAALAATRRLRELPVPGERGWRRLVAGDGPVRFDSLASLLGHQMDLAAGMGGHALERELPGYALERTRLRAELERRGREVSSPGFCHVDLAPGIVLVLDTVAGVQVSGIIDVSPHALCADPVLDEVGLAVMVAGYPGAEADSEWLAGVVAEALDSDAWLVDAYRRFYACYWQMDPASLPWCLKQFGCLEQLGR